MDIVIITYENYAEELYNRCGYFFCENCGANSNKAYGFDRHHIIFRSEKPGHPEIHNGRNIILLCRKCHEEAHGDKERFRSHLIYLRDLVTLFDL